MPCLWNGSSAVIRRASSKVIHSKNVKTATSVLAILREERTTNRQNALIDQGFCESATIVNVLVKAVLRQGPPADIDQELNVMLSVVSQTGQ